MTGHSRLHTGADSERIRPAAITRAVVRVLHTDVRDRVVAMASLTT